MVVTELLSYTPSKWLHILAAKHWTYGLVNVAFKDFNTIQPGENDTDRQTIKLAWKYNNDI